MRPSNHSAAAQRAAARRQREDAAPRLVAEIPRLTALALKFVERRVKAGGGTQSTDAVPHVRRVVVQHAPALFDVPCTSRGCQDGGHDLTRAILQALAAGERRGEGEVAFSGSDACSGYDAAGQRCELELHYDATATFAPPPI